jgi:hypothetical protein
LVLLTCRIANLCISPVHAGIISFKTPNSSFIFDLRLRSIKLCAVFRAILRPATLVEDGCFFFGAELAGFPADAFEASLKGSGASSGCPRGLIWIIFLDLVGGGGRAKVSLVGTCAADERRRILTTSLAGIAGDFGEVGWYEEAEEDFVDDALEGWDSPLATAGGGSSKDICREEKWNPSFPLISADGAGVGGWLGRGMIIGIRFHA